MAQLARARPRWQYVSLTDTPGLFDADLAAAEVAVERLYARFRPHLPLHALAYLFPQTAATLALANWLRRQRPACVWGWQFLANVVAAPAARLAGVGRVVIRVENLSAWKTWRPHRHWWNRPADRMAARLADCVVVNAPALVEDFSRWAGVPGEKIVVLPNAVDAAGWRARPWRDRRGELGIGAGEVVVLTVGRLAREKNQALLLRASAQLHRQGWRHHLVVVGEGELAGQLAQLSEQLGLGSWVHWVGATATLQDFYRSADLFALSSDIEGLPNVILEAQALGLPVVTTAAGGAPEVVQDGETGYVVACGAQEELADRLARLIADPALRRRFGEAGKARVDAHFALAQWLARVEELSRPGGDGGPF